MGFCPGGQIHGCNSEHYCLGGGGYFPEGGGQSTTATQLNSPKVHVSLIPSAPVRVDVAY